MGSQGSWTATANIWIPTGRLWTAQFAQNVFGIFLRLNWNDFVQKKCHRVMVSSYILVSLGGVPAGQERFELIFYIILQLTNRSIHRFEIRLSELISVGGFMNWMEPLRVHVASHVRPTGILLIEDLGSALILHLAHSGAWPSHRRLASDQHGKMALSLNSGKLDAKTFPTYTSYTSYTSFLHFGKASQVSQVSQAPQTLATFGPTTWPRVIICVHHPLNHLLKESR